MADYEPSPEEIADISHALGREYEARRQAYRVHQQFAAASRSWLAGEAELHEYARFIQSELGELEARRKDD